MKEVQTILPVLFVITEYLPLLHGIPPTPIPSTYIRKCCEKNKFIVNNDCQRLEHNQTDLWNPFFKDAETLEPVTVSYRMTYGFPDCQFRQQWKVLNDTNSCDKLVLLKDGKLRHYAYANHEDRSKQCDDEEIEKFEKESYEYEFTDYCVDNFRYTDSKIVGQIGVICVPKSTFSWIDTDSTIRRVVNPVFHGLSIVFLLTVAIIYFVLPQLCDLIGNIITTISVCLICTHVADIIRSFIEFHSEFSYLTVDTAIHISTLCAFFWLNSFGYYIWKIFRSRNVFLRITDGKKYCYYSIYVYGSTMSMAFMALFAHFVLDTSNLRKELKGVTDVAIGELGIAVFFTTIAFIILVNIFFSLSTVQVINRMSTYGRIHHKLKYNFQLFVKIFIIMTINWFFYTLSQFPHKSFFYVHVFTNLFQSIAIFYVTIIRSRKVSFLLRKACCHDKCICSCCRPGDPDEATDWGEEMMAMNLSSY